jgi:sugar phosphate isomerase/epimerase
MTKSNHPIRLGGPVFTNFSKNPDKWVNLHREWGYAAAYCPLDSEDGEELIKSFESAALKSNLVIAEVGAWSNPISPDEIVRKKAFDHCCGQLELADRIGAKCCVNIAGSRDPQKWDGPHQENLRSETFDMIVEVTQKIIDTVKPKRTFFTLETMPWIFPNSIESYEALIEKINREHFAVHFDPVNLIDSPDRYYSNGLLIREAFQKLGPFIKSCHAKDTIITSDLTTHLNETQPGLGNLDYVVYLQELSKLNDVPLMLEHMKEPDQYRSAITHLKGVAKNNNLEFLRL